MSLGDKIGPVESICFGLLVLVVDWGGNKLQGPNENVLKYAKGLNYDLVIITVIVISEDPGVSPEPTW